MKKEIIIDGMHCNKCVKRIEDNLNNINGVIATVNLETKSAIIVSENEISNETLTQIIDDTGFDVVEIKTI